MSDPILTSLNEAESQVAESRVRITKASDLIQHVRILDPEGVDLQKMEAWPLAFELMDEFWPKHKRTVIIKPRQMGVSWDFALYCLHHCGWKRYRTVGSVNTTKEEAAELIARMRVLWQTMPAHIRPKASWSEFEVKFANGSKAEAIATKDVSGAGHTYSLMGIDEAGLIKNLGENWAALLPAVEKGELHVFSTPRSATSKYASLVKAARAGEGPFVIREIDWWERPDRDQSTEEGRAWLAARKAELSPQEFAREYEKQFQRPGSSYFTDDVMQTLRRTACAPKETLWQGRLRIWKRPEPNAKYVIGADVAEGLDDGDYSAASVFNRLTGEEVASYHGHVRVEPYGEDLVRLAKIYNRAWIGVEANNHGHAVCSWIYFHCRYKKLLRETRDAEGQVSPQSRYRLGILNTVASKPAMLTELDSGIRTGSIIIRDKAAVEEFETFMFLEDGSYGGAPGSHDDRVVARMLAQSGRGRRVPKCA